MQKRLCSKHDELSKQICRETSDRCSDVSLGHTLQKISILIPFMLNAVVKSIRVGTRLFHVVGKFTFYTECLKTAGSFPTYSVLRIGDTRLEKP